MSELKKILWKLEKRHKNVKDELFYSTNDSDKAFWLGSSITIFRAIYLIKKEIRKVECIS